MIETSNKNMTENMESAGIIFEMHRYLESDLFMPVELVSAYNNRLEQIELRVLSELERLRRETKTDESMPAVPLEDEFSFFGAGGRHLELWNLLAENATRGSRGQFAAKQEHSENAIGFTDLQIPSSYETTSTDVEDNALTNTIIRLEASIRQECNGDHHATQVIRVTEMTLRGVS